MDPYAGISTRATPQVVAIPGRPDMVKNSAGGFTFQVDDAARLRRFLLLGSDGATYYSSAAELTRDNAEVVFRMAETQHGTLRRVILEVSEAGSAPRVQATLFALAIACSVGADDERGAALALIPRVCRTGTHLFQFTTYVEQFRGWGRGLRTAVAQWYTKPDVGRVAYQAVKYRQRGGWSHRDLLRLAHPELGTAGWDNTESRASLAQRKALFDWICGREVPKGAVPAIVEGWTKVQTKPHKAAKLVRKYGLTWEMLPDEALADREVWDALLDGGMGATALMRQLPRLTRLGVVGPMGAGRTRDVAARLADPELLKRGRVHPINVLIAHRTYASGRSDRGAATWAPVRELVDALDDAFYAAYGSIEPSGKRTMQCLDVSGSMAMSTISNLPLTPREASAAIALVTTATEPNTMVVGFSDGRANNLSSSALMHLPLSPKQRLTDAVQMVSGLPFSRTDCALPMQVAQAQGLEVDQFVIYTDNETWYGGQHPVQALADYRRSSGIDAKLVVVSMTATGFSIADPRDPGMLDVVGFDTAVPQLIADFARS